MTKIGIDNGVSGSIGIIDNDEVAHLYSTPTYKALKYTKKKGYITRIDVDKMKEILEPFVDDKPLVKIERPMVNPKRFVATSSALRALEATLITLEQLGLGYEFVDSKGWQKEFLPIGIKGSSKLKEASKLRGIQLYPYLEEEIEKQGDADALFISKI